MIKKTSTFGVPTTFGNIKNDYIRRIFNNTGVPIRITDASGRCIVHAPIPHPKHSCHDRELVIEEWFDGTNTNGMVDVREEYDGFYHSTMAVNIKLSISLNDLAELPDGIYLEECSLHICLATFESTITHPRVCETLYKQLLQRTGMFVGVELLDPRKCMGTMYATISGVVYTLSPRRTPTPSKEGVALYYRNSMTGIMDEKVYPLEDLMKSPGIDGIRIYRTEVEALEDLNNPELSLIEKSKHELRTKRDAIFNEGLAEGKRIVTEELNKTKLAHDEKIRKTIDEANKIKLAADEKLKRSEDILDKVRHTQRNDKTGIWAGFIKMCSSFIGFFRVLFI
jgi:hypothetical protein